MRNILFFSLIVLSCGWLGRLVDVKAGVDESGSLGQLIWIVCPLLSMVLFRMIGGDGWKDLGIRPHILKHAPFYLVCLLFAPCCALLIMGIGRFMLLDTASLSAPFLAAFGMALLPSFVKNIFEEFAWRGYLAPKVYAFGWHTWAAHVYIGLIWAAWHLPYLHRFVDTTDDYFFPRFIIGIVVLSIVYGEIRLLTGSVWPAVLMHTVGNAFIDTLILSKYIVIREGYEFLMTPSPDGLIAILFTSLIAWWLYSIRVRKCSIPSTRN